MHFACTSIDMYYEITQFSHSCIVQIQKLKITYHLKAKKKRKKKKENIFISVAIKSCA